MYVLHPPRELMSLAPMLGVMLWGKLYGREPVMVMPASTPWAGQCTVLVLLIILLVNSEHSTVHSVQYKVHSVLVLLPVRLPEELRVWGRGWG